MAEVEVGLGVVPRDVDDVAEEPGGPGPAEELAATSSGGRWGPRQRRAARHVSIWPFSPVVLSTPSSPGGAPCSTC